MAHKKTLADELRAAIEASGESRYAISMKTGVDQSSLSKFVLRQTDLSLDNADKLAKHLGLRLSPADQPKKTKARRPG